MVTRYSFNTDPLQDLNRWFSGFGADRIRFPSISLTSNADEATVVAQVPGVDPKDISLTLTGDVLTIEGKLEEEPFSRSILLPFDVHADQAKATTEHGILRINLPRTEASKPRKIAVQHVA